MTTRNNFTLIEVVIAIAILAIGLVTAMSIIIQSNTRMDNAFKKWREQHILAQAAESFLLQGPNSQPTQDTFPYMAEGYSVACSIEEPEGLPSVIEAHSHNWRLARLRITLNCPDGQTTRSLLVEKVLKEEIP